MLQNATTLRKWAPWPPNISDEHVFCTAPATRNASLQILFKCPTPAIVSGNAAKPSRFAHFWQGAQSFAPATRNDIWTSKSGANMRCFVHLHSEMCFAPQRRAPTMVCFVHFDLDMCFAPQRRALFRHLNFQKWSEAEVFCTFWLGNVLRATTACTFSSLISPAGSAPAALASLLFNPPEPQIIGTQCFAAFLPFRASAYSFFWPFLFSDLLSSNLSLLSASALLCFSSVHIVGSLTSKLPSINGSNIWLMVVNKNLGVGFLTILKNHGVRQLGRMTYYGKVNSCCKPPTRLIMDYSANKNHHTSNHCNQLKLFCFFDLRGIRTLGEEDRRGGE